jgi:hypothetical protein
VKSKEFNPPCQSSESAQKWQQKVAEIPSLFARLIYFSSLRESPDGLFFDSGVHASSSATDQLIRTEQSQTFSRFLGLSLEQIAEDLGPYLETYGSSRTPDLVDLARDIIPPSASVEDVAFFLGTITILDSIIKNRKKR